VVPVAKQYREADGQFYVKLMQGEQVLLLSPGFAQGKEAGQWWARVKAEGAAAAAGAQQLEPGLDEALAALRAADAAKAAAAAAAKAG